MSALPALPVPPVQPLSWGEVSNAFSRAAVKSGADYPTLAATTGIDAADIEGFAQGKCVLGSFELEQLAGALGTTPGSWLCGDEAPLFRGAAGADASEQAVRLGAELMTEFLALEAIAS